MQNNNKKNDIMFDVFIGWSRGDKFTMRRHLSSAYQEKENQLKTKYETIEAEEVNRKEVDNGKTIKAIAKRI